MEYVMRPIGVIRTPFSDPSQTPIQPSRSKAEGTVEVDAAYEEGLEDLEGFSHIILVYLFHCSSGYSLKVKPFLDDRQHGLFSTRYPRRPNPIGLSVVRLIGREGRILHIAGADVLDGTPLLDIKPYVPEFDAQADVRFGWLEPRA
jgi:tRNA-Thr(GGU) m(6)t(6)A37 methyltransferase TsaA